MGPNGSNDFGLLSLRWHPHFLLFGSCDKNRRRWAVLNSSFFKNVRSRTGDSTCPHFTTISSHVSWHQKLLHELYTCEKMPHKRREKFCMEHFYLCPHNWFIVVSKLEKTSEDYYICGFTLLYLSWCRHAVENSVSKPWIVYLTLVVMQLLLCPTISLINASVLIRKSLPITIIWA